MGGVRTDLRGRSTLAGLYAAGEVACTGVHGANRLASNSLLEGLVFGARAGESAVADSCELRITNYELKSKDQRPKTKDQSSEISTAVRKRVKRVMWERVGILRDADSLTRALREFEQIGQANLGTSSRNFVSLAKLAATAALWREESRGGHYRTDFPERDNVNFDKHSIQKLHAEIASSERINFTKE
jgi:L-aspartate oxidase